ncbi:hypothetical protein LCGC14_0995320 [marine sediment metagenome]|uniref:Uncharacterized protein n=1 Tax=marine sediment metagenome TaxID=412755 RepID=A0A0F9N985_9ZZZZ
MLEAETFKTSNTQIKRSIQITSETGTVYTIVVEVYSYGDHKASKEYNLNIYNMNTGELIHSVSRTEWKNFIWSAGIAIQQVLNFNATERVWDSIISHA